jgi:hypothetical protein
MSQIKEFNDYRQKMNDRIMAQDNKVLKRFFSLDHQTYSDGAPGCEDQRITWPGSFDGFKV